MKHETRRARRGVWPALLGCLLLGGLPAAAVEPLPHTRAWQASLGLAAGMTGADLVSSWGCRELNPMMRSADGRVGRRALLVKAGATSFVLSTQIVLTRRHPQWRRWLTWLNLGSAAFNGAVVAWNLRQR